MTNWFKKLFIPSGEKVTVTAYKSWVVRWYSIYNPYSFISPDEREQMEIFPSEQDAILFANQIKDAFKLTRSPDFAKYVNIEENQNTLANMPTH